jgi:hypothetical protein
VIARKQLHKQHVIAIEKNNCKKQVKSAIAKNQFKKKVPCHDTVRLRLA